MFRPLVLIKYEIHGNVPVDIYYFFTSKTKLLLRKTKLKLNPNQF